MKRETSSSILAEKGKSWRPVGGAPELGREGEEGEWGVEEGGVVREGGGKQEGRRPEVGGLFRFEGVGEGWDILGLRFWGEFGALCATQI